MSESIPANNETLPPPDWQEYNRRGLAHAAAGDWKAAAVAFAEAQERLANAEFEDDDAIGSANAVVSSNLSAARFHSGEPEAALTEARGSLHIREQLWGNTLATARAASDCATITATLGRFYEARAYIRRAIGIAEATCSEDSPDLVTFVGNAARLEIAAGDYGLAEPLILKWHGLLAAAGLPAQPAVDLFNRVVASRSDPSQASTSATVEEGSAGWPHDPAVEPLAGLSDALLSPDPTPIGPGGDGPFGADIDDATWDNTFDADDVDRTPGDKIIGYDADRDDMGLAPGSVGRDEPSDSFDQVELVEPGPSEEAILLVSDLPAGGLPVSDAPEALTAEGVTEVRDTDAATGAWDTDAATGAWDTDAATGAPDVDVATDVWAADGIPDFSAEGSDDSDQGSVSQPDADSAHLMPTDPETESSDNGSDRPFSTQTRGILPDNRSREIPVVLPSPSRSHSAIRSETSQETEDAPRNSVFITGSSTAVKTERRPRKVLLDHPRARASGGARVWLIVGGGLTAVALAVAWFLLQNAG